MNDMRRLLPLLALLGLATACRSPDLTTVQDAPTQPVIHERQVVEFPKLEDLDPELRKKAEALIAQLGAESFKDRRKARKALKAMEPAIIPLLESHAGDEEPEIREALPMIIKLVRAKLDVTIPDIKLTLMPIKLTLMPIKPGTFMMGSDSGDRNEKPARKVMLTKTFWMGKTEVTQSQYEAIMGKNPSKFQGANNPVELVSWTEAVEFCKKLTQREHKVGRLPATQEYRLPTEAEWEYCCRAGTTTKYSFGDDESKISEHAWHRENSSSKTHPAAEKKPNDWGLYDMHGNVYEWCQDWFGNYPSGAQVDPTGPASGSYRVDRGGSWGSSARFCRSAFRGRSTPSRRYNGLGFRLVRAQVAKKVEAK
jgi:formylglycine-generating enzyme required for sulfatase activity